MNSTHITLRVDNNVTYIDGKMESSLYKKFKKCLGYTPEESYWMIKANEGKGKEKWRKEWDGTISAVCYNQHFCKCFSKKKGTHFHTGLLSRAVDFFDQHEISASCVDIRSKVSSNNLLQKTSGFEKRDYQSYAVGEIVNKERGIVKICTGGGKTIIGSHVIAERSVFPSIFYVPSIDLLKQAKDEIERFVQCSEKKLEVGMLGGGHKEIKDINVMTIQTAVRALGGKWVKFDEEDKAKDDTDISDIQKDIKDLIRGCRLMIADEVQHWAAETCQIISDASESCRYKYGFSATPYRDKGDDILIEGCFGKTIVDINASKLIREGYLVRPTIYFVPFKHGKLGLSNYANIYKEGIVNNIKRNEIIAALANGYHEEGKNVLVLIKQIAHGKLLEEIIPHSTFLHGSISGKKRQEHLEKMRSGESRVTISSVIFDEGIDCKPLDTLILGGSGKSATRALQRVGRVLRPYKNKTEATVIDFYDHYKYLKDHSKKREKMYKEEDEFIIKNDKGF